MKELNLKFWILAGWLSISLVMVTSFTDFRLLLAALVNLYICVSAVKSHEKDFEKFFKKMQ